jgi:hypothetical protein
MNGNFAHPPVQPEHKPGWSHQRLIFLIGFALAAHVALVFIFGTRKEVSSRPVVNVPQFQFADSSSESIALDDPTLFALPHANDFGSSVWLKTPIVTAPSFAWTEPPRYLPLAGSLTSTTLGTAFTKFMQTNPVPQLKLNFKPDPQIVLPEAPEAPILPQSSTLQIAGPLAQRPLLNHLDLPAQPYNDVIPPSTVQALVDTRGNVLSVVLLDSSTVDAADQQAMRLACTLRFAPAPQLTLGTILFNWHTVPLNATNAP